MPTAPFISPVIPEVNLEIEHSDCGCNAYPEDNVTIRRRDVHGNTEEVRRPEDEGWQEWADLFPDFKLEIEE